MSVVVYQEGKLYSDYLMLGKSIVGTTTVYRQPKIVVCPKSNITIGFTGENLLEFEISIIEKLYIYYLTVYELRSKFRGVSNDVKQLFTVQNTYNELRDSIRETNIQIPECIVGTKDFVCHMKFGILEIPQITHIVEEELFCIGSDSLSVYCLILLGETPESAIKKAAKKSSTITEDSYCVELLPFNTSFLKTESDYMIEES